MSNQAPLNYVGEAVVTLPVSNLRKAQRWYTQTLNLQTLRALDDPPWCEMTSSVDGLRIGLAEVEYIRPGGITLTLTVVNVDEARETLLAARVDVSDVVSVGDVTRVLSLLDPDGNPLMLREGTL